MCGSLYPDMCEVDGELLPIFDFQKPDDTHYIVFEVLGMPSGKNFSVVEIPDDYMLEVGRSNSEICIPDVSVSKKHATMKFDMSVGELVLNDSGSKYGTQIVIQRPLKLHVNQPLFVVNGLALIKVELKEDEKTFAEMCCSCFGKPSRNEAQEQELRSALLPYEDIRQYLPSDLQQYEDELSKVPERTRKECFDRFCRYTPHLMPIARNAYYVKCLDSEPDAMSVVYSSMEMTGSLRNSINLQKNQLRSSLLIRE